MEKKPLFWFLTRTIESDECDIEIPDGFYSSLENAMKSSDYGVDGWHYNEDHDEWHNYTAYIYPVYELDKKFEGYN